MKTTFFKTATTALVIIIITSCGGGKNATLSQKSATGFEAIEKDMCQTEAEKKPGIRAYGTGQHFKEMTARNIAEAQARAQFVRAIAVSIITSTDEEANTNISYDGDMNGANILQQQNSGNEDWVNSIAEGEIRNTAVIQTCPSFNSTTKQYKVSVCLEYNGDAAELANSITNKIQKLSTDRKLEMNFEFEQYRKRIEANLEKKKHNQ
jgi:hypothetical protein